MKYLFAVTKLCFMQPIEGTVISFGDDRLVDYALSDEVKDDAQIIQDIASDRQSKGVQPHVALKTDDILQKLRETPPPLPELVEEISGWKMNTPAYKVIREGTEQTEAADNNKKTTAGKKKR